VAAAQEELVLEIERVLPARPADVFAAFTDPQLLASWWGPAGFTIPGVDFPVREGAEYRIEMLPPEGDAFFLRGEMREVDPPRRIAFTFAWEEPDPDDVETLAELSFDDLDGSTRTRLRQGPFKTEVRLELHRGGWSDSFDKLERVL